MQRTLNSQNNFDTTKLEGLHDLIFGFNEKATTFDFIFSTKLKTIAFNLGLGIKADIHTDQ